MIEIQPRYPIFFDKTKNKPVSRMFLMGLYEQFKGRFQGISNAIRINPRWYINSHKYIDLYNLIGYFYINPTVPVFLSSTVKGNYLSNCPKPLSWMITVVDKIAEFNKTHEDSQRIFVDYIIPEQEIPKPKNRQVLSKASYLEITCKGVDVPFIFNSQNDKWFLHINTVSKMLKNIAITQDTAESFVSCVKQTIKDITTKVEEEEAVYISNREQTIAQLNERIAQQQAEKEKEEK